MINFPHAVQPQPPAPPQSAMPPVPTIPGWGDPFQNPAAPASNVPASTVPQMGHPGLQGLANMFAPIGQRALASLGGQAQPSGVQSAPLY